MAKHIPVNTDFLMPRDEDSKLLLITAKTHGYDSDYSSSEVQFKELTTLKEILNQIQFWNVSVQNALVKEETFLTAMRNMGFVQLSDIENSEKFTYLPNFFIGDNSYLARERISLAQLPTVAERLAEVRCHLYQEINKESLKTINPMAYAKMKSQEKSIEKRQKDYAKKQKDREAAKKQAKIEQAKKLLKEAGELK